MLSRIDSRELSEWQAFYEIEPWGDVRADWRQGQTSMLLANIHRDKKAQPFKVSDFMLDTEPKKPMSMAEIKQVLKRTVRR